MNKGIVGNLVYYSMIHGCKWPTSAIAALTVLEYVALTSHFSFQQYIRLCTGEKLLTPPSHLTPSCMPPFGPMSSCCQ